MMVKALFFFILLLGGIMVFANDTIISAPDTLSLVQTAKTNTVGTADDFSPAIMAVFFFGVLILCLTVAVGIVLAALTLLMIVVLVALGVISTSVIMGLKKNSVTTAVKTFIYLGCGIAGLFTGASLMLLMVEVFSLHFTVLMALLIGGTGGLLAGLLVGLLLFAMYLQMTWRIRQLLKIIKGEAPMER